MVFYFVSNIRIMVCHELDDISCCVKIASTWLSSHAFITIATIHRYIAQPYNCDGDIKMCNGNE